MVPKVSIIVPIYNAEGYLCRCLDSLLAQRLNAIEIIAVNDGSIDKSLDLLYIYAEKDSRLVIINKQNSGVSSARNTGISAATGEYIGFVDADDWLDCNMYKEMYNTAVEDKADIVMCSYLREFGSHSKAKNFDLPGKVYYPKKEVHSIVMRRLVGPLKEEMANPEFLDAWGTVWSKIYRSEIIKKNNVEFKDLKEIGTNEDLLFNIFASYFSNNFVFINKHYYHYWRANESSYTSGYNPNLINQWFTLFGIIERFLKDKEMEQDFHLALNNRICLGILGLGFNTISKLNKNSALAKIYHLRILLKDDRMKTAFQIFDLSYFSWPWRVFYAFARYRFAEGLYVMLITINFLRQIIR